MKELSSDTDKKPVNPLETVENILKMWRDKRTEWRIWVSQREHLPACVTLYNDVMAPIELAISHLTLIKKELTDSMADNGWIKCSDRLPEIKKAGININESEWHLVVDRKVGIIRIAKIMVDRWITYNGHEVYPTDWRELPAAPAENPQGINFED